MATQFPMPIPTGLSNLANINAGQMAGVQSIGTYLKNITTVLDGIDSTLTDILQSVTQATKNLPPASTPKSDKAGFLGSFQMGKLGDLFAQGAGFAQSGFGELARSGLNLLPSPKDMGKAFSGIAPVVSAVGKPLASGAAKVSPVLGSLATNATSGIAAAIGPLGTALGAVAGAAALSVGAMTGLAAASVSLTKSFASVSAPLAAVFARSEIRDTYRGMRIGAGITDSAAGMMKALGDLKDKFEPYFVGILNWMNKATTGFFKNVIAIIQMLERLYDTIVEWRFGEGVARARRWVRTNEEHLRELKAKEQATAFQDYLRTLTRQDMGKFPERKFN